MKRILVLCLTLVPAFAVAQSKTPAADALKAVLARGAKNRVARDARDASAASGSPHESHARPHGDGAAPRRFFFATKSPNLCPYGDSGFRLTRP